MQMKQMQHHIVLLLLGIFAKQEKPMPIHHTLIIEMVLISGDPPVLSPCSLEPHLYINGLSDYYADTVHGLTIGSRVQSTSSGKFSRSNILAGSVKTRFLRVNFVDGCESPFWYPVFQNFKR